MKLAEAARHRDLYPDRYLNVFVPYRSEGLDANVTRALISTLRWSRPELAREFLAEVARVKADGGEWCYDLQACDYEDFDPATAKTQVVLGISRRGELATKLPPLDDPEQSAALLTLLRAPLPLAERLERLRRALLRPDLDLDDMAVLAHTLEELEEGCLPDAWVFSADAGVCVLVEAKLTALLDLSQLQRYADVYYGRSYGAEDMALATWEAVAGFFAAHRDDPDPRTAFLSGQLVDYLDLLGLAPFCGFKPYDFDLDAFQQVLPKFLRFADALRAAAVEQGLPLGEARPDATGARIAFSDPGIPGELVLELREEGILIEYACGDAALGRLPGRAAVDAVLEARGGEAEAGALAELLAAAAEDLPALTVRVERLRADGEDGVPYADLETYRAPLDAESLALALAELRRQHPPLERARDAAGRVRMGRLALGNLIERSAALGGAEPLLAAALPLVTALSRLARGLVPHAVEAAES